MRDFSSSVLVYVKRPILVIPLIHRSMPVKSSVEKHSGAGDPSSGSSQRGTLKLISASFAFYLSAISFHDRELC